MAYTQLTLGTLRSRLQAKYEDVPFWTDTEANFTINEVLQWYNLYTGVWRKRVSLTTVADQVYYTVPSTLIYNTRMEFNGRSTVISSFDDLDNGRPGWESETTTDGGAVPTLVQVWLPLGMNQFAIWPADGAGNNNLMIDGVRATPVLTNDSDFIDLDETEIDAVLGEALFLLAFKDSGRFSRVQGWHQEFLKTVASHNARLNASDQFRAAMGADVNRTTRPLSVGEA